MRIKSLPAPQSPGYLISFDFDDTLYDWESEVKIPAAFFQLIEEWRNQFGILWGINTGRSYEFLKEGYETIAQAPFAPDFTITMERDIHMADEGLHLRPFLPWNDKCREDHSALFKKYGARLDQLFLQIEELFPHIEWWLQPDDAYSIQVENPLDLHGIAGYIEEFIKQYPDLSIQRAGPYLRFCHADYSKGTALQQVSFLAGIQPENLCAIGDGHNDIDTLRINVQAYCACPHNGVDELKKEIAKRSGYISPHNYSAGTMDILKQYVSPLLHH